MPGMPADLILERQLDDAALLACVPRLVAVTAFSEEQLRFAAGCARGSLGRRWVLSLIRELALVDPVGAA